MYTEIRKAGFYIDMAFLGKGVVLMKTDTGWIVVVLVIFPLYNQLIFRSAVLHLFELGKSKRFLKTLPDDESLGGIL